VKIRRLTPAAYRRAERWLAANDPVFARFIEIYGRCGLASGQREDPFVAMVEAIVWQQLSGKAAATIYGRVLDLLPGRALTPTALLVVPESALRAAGLSRAKAAYIRDLAQRVIDGRLHLDRLEQLDDVDVIAELTQVKGIGRWTAEMFLMFRLHRPDVLPVGDLGIVKAIQRAYGLRKPPSPQRMEKIAAAWRPYRSVATWYLWRSLATVVPGAAKPGPIVVAKVDHPAGRVSAIKNGERMREKRRGSA
jgi:DNA-3-methyladenine glycosylase II